MNEKFTPGPWISDTVPNSQGIIIGHFMDIFNHSGRKGERIARLFGKSKVRLKANCNLIKSSPDMYSALKEMYDYEMKEYEKLKIDSAQLSLPPYWDKIKAALSKANPK